MLPVTPTLNTSVANLAILSCSQPTLHWGVAISWVGRLMTVDLEVGSSQRWLTVVSDVACRGRITAVVLEDRPGIATASDITMA